MGDENCSDLPLRPVDDAEPEDPLVETLAEYFGTLPGQDAHELRDEIRALSVTESADLIASVTGRGETLHVLVIAAEAGRKRAEDQLGARRTLGHARS